MNFNFDPNNRRARTSTRYRPANTPPKSSPPASVSLGLATAKC